jgi:hypothetical protein
MSIGERILNNFNKRMATEVTSTRCGRIDLQMTDFDPVSPTEATVMLEYSRQSGVPKRTQVAEWVTSSFNGLLRADVETLLHYPDLSAVTAQVRVAGLQMPMDDKFLGRMMRCGSAEYMDADSAVWEVREGDTGKYLVRKSADNIENLLAERLERMKVGSLHHAPKLRHVVTAGISDPNVGDHVEFLDPKDEMARKYGKVTKVTSDKVTISAKGESITTDKMNLIAVTKESPQSEKERKQMEKDFYAEYYFSGDTALAAKLVK